MALHVKKTEPNCKTVNAAVNVVCYQCGGMLSEEYRKALKEKEKQIESFIEQNKQMNERIEKLEKLILVSASEETETVHGDKKDLEISLDKMKNNMILSMFI